MHLTSVDIFQMWSTRGTSGACGLKLPCLTVQALQQQGFSGLSATPTECLGKPVTHSCLSPSKTSRQGQYLPFIRMHVCMSVAKTHLGWHLFIYFVIFLFIFSAIQAKVSFVFQLLKCKDLLFFFCFLFLNVVHTKWANWIHLSWALRNHELPFFRL